MSVDEKLGIILNGMSEIKTDIHKINSRLGRMQDTIDEMKQDISEIKAEQAVMKQDISDIKSEQKMIRTIIENEVLRQIQIVAEGHIMLMHRIKEMQEMYSKYEEIGLKVECLIIEMHDVKRRIAKAGF